MTYEGLLQQQPPSTAAGNKAAARVFVTQINTFLSSGFTFSDSQRNYLYKLRARWEQRAAGMDERWNDHGSRPGRKKQISERSLASTVDPTAFGSDEQKDPLLLRLERKFGIPKRTDDI
jgi:hypothetical protein